MMYNDSIKEKYWEQLSQKPWPPSITAKRLAKLKILVWNDADYFWWNIITRNRPDNFWGMLMEVAFRYKIIKADKVR